uniref:Peptidase M56, BlaR1 n=1 Tax=Solibacter usitatus (strain Ellin6076) TaxID=234267 RepID=Q01XZ5_SOLUE
MQRAPIIHTIGSVISGSIPVWLAALSAGVCFCQTRPACAEFEVASIKAAAPLDTSRTVAFGRQIDGAQVHFTQTSLRDFIRIAWAVRDYQVEAPSWAASARFNVSAKLPEGCTQKQVPGMLQAMLADRFGLKLHRGSKDLAVFGLVVRGDGLKVKESPTEQPEGNGASGAEQVKLAGGGGRGGVIDYGGGSYFALPHYRMEGRKLPMNLFAALLGAMTDRPVIDQTGLSGRYDFDLQLTEDDYDAMTVRAMISIGEAPSAMDLQQMAAAGDPLPRVLRGLGLELKAGKGHVEVVIVDEVRKEPTEN